MHGSPIADWQRQEWLHTAEQRWQQQAFETAAWSEEDSSLTSQLDSKHIPVSSAAVTSGSSSVPWSQGGSDAASSNLYDVFNAIYLNDDASDLDIMS